MKLLTVVGTRPEIIRLSCVIPKLDQYCDQTFVYTGQSYDINMKDVFFRDFQLRLPDCSFTLGGNSLGEQISIIIRELSYVIDRVNPDKLLVLGDTNSGIAAFVAKRMGVKIYHMEAGNRCYDNRSPEELNRKVIDHCSDILMPYTERSRSNLLAEGIASNKIFLTGNPIYEIMQRFQRESKVTENMGLEKGGYILLTIHREENVENMKELQCLLTGCILVSRELNYPVIFIRHPRTEKIMRAWGVDMPQIQYHEPVGFFDFMALEDQAACVITDSGTVQEECSLKKIRCVTARNFTERPETIECGSNILSGLNPDNLLRCVKLAMASETRWEPPGEYLEKNVSDKVVKLIIGK